MKLRFILILIISITWGFTACSTLGSTPTPTPAPTMTATPLPSETPTPTATPTPLTPLIVLLRPPESNVSLADPLEAALRQQAETASMRWQVRPSMNASDVGSDLHLLVALPGVINVLELVAAAPKAQFLAIGIPELTTAPNLTTVQLEDNRPDQLGFIAGFIASMLTPDYRSGMIGIAEDPAARAAYLGFLNGDTYYCGMCLQQYPPHYNYPLYVEAPAGASTADWLGNGEYLVNHEAETVFIYPGAGDDATLKRLIESGINLLGVELPAEDMRSNWIASLRSDPLPIILDLIPQLLNGQGGQTIIVPLQITDINDELFSPGRQHYANEVLADLLAGYTDTGVDPQTGELK